MKLSIIGFIILVSSCSLMAQSVLFETQPLATANLSSDQSNLINRIQTKTNIDKTYSVHIIEGILHSSEISFTIDGNKIKAYLIKENIRGTDNYTWFGETEEGEGVFFYVNDGKVASKFNIGNEAYTLIPMNESAHTLIKFKNTDVGVCGTDDVAESLKSVSSDDKSLLDDAECTLRVLIATTPTSRQEITNSGFDIPTFGQIAVDEANMAYISSQINITMELAALIETNYTESLGNFHATDVSRLRNGTDGLEPVHTARESYNTDIQVLIRRNEGGIFGRAFYIPTDTAPLDEANAFCTVSVDGITDGRFSFTHEIGHLQGGRHENHNTGPTFARGFLSSSATNAWRTIMTRTGAAPCTQANSCRIGVLSNPNINGPGGVPAGTADRNNARRINETSIDINNFREVPALLSLNSETIIADQVSNHLANTTIDTDNQTIIYQSGSISTMRAEGRITLRPGTHIQSGAEFRAYLASAACENLPNLRLAQSADGGGELNLMENLNSNNIEDLEVEVFPNPAIGGTINLKINAKDPTTYQVKVYDMQGNLLVVRPFEESQIKVDLNDLKEGLYLFEVTKDNIRLIKRIIKK